MSKCSLIEMHRNSFWYGSKSKKTIFTMIPHVLRYYLTDTGEIWQKIHDFLIFSEEMDQFMYS